MVCLSNHQFNELQSHFYVILSHAEAIRSILAVVKQQSTPPLDVRQNYLSRPMTKSELAQLANVSTRTLLDWLRPFRKSLREMGVSDNAKVLPAEAVQFLCRQWEITFDQSNLTR